MIKLQGSVARGGHVLPKLLLGPDMPYPSMTCGWTQARTENGPRQSSTPLGTLRQTPLLNLQVKVRS
jgi:hypothetical protein